MTRTTITTISSTPSSLPNLIESLHLLLISSLISYYYPTIPSLLNLVTIIIGVSFRWVIAPKISNGSYSNTSSFDRDGTLAGSCLISLLLSLLNAKINSSLYYGLPLYSLLSSLTGIAFICSQIVGMSTINPVQRRRQRWDSWVMNIIIVIMGGGIIVFGNSMGALLLSVISFVAFYATMMSCYKSSTNNDENSSSSSPTSSSPSQSLQRTLSHGEWHSTSLTLSILTTDYAVRLSFDDMTMSAPHLIVSHAGVMGCLMGCLCSFSLSSRGVNQSMGGRCIFIIAFTVGQLEWIMRRCETRGVSFVEEGGRWLFFEWLGYFLGGNEDPEGRYYCPHGSSLLSSHYPRYVCLLYWSILLCLLSYPSFLLYRQLNTTANTTVVNKTRRSHVVIVYRKFFHFVAVVLFLPVTISHPMMMTLSYVIAICLLLFLECIRSPAIGDGDGDGDVGNGVESTGVTMMMNVMNRFYDTFRDDKDANDDFVITHIALVVGCAIPQIIHNVMSSYDDDGGFCHYKLLPHIGVIVLGVGDAFGAIIGVSYGRRRLFIPSFTSSSLSTNDNDTTGRQQRERSNDNKKTWEGSMGMLVGMVIVAYVGRMVGWWNVDDLPLWGILISLTVMEACITDQIDNFYLPVWGVILCLLWE